MPYAASRAGDLRIISKAQWDKDGQEGYEKRPAGTGSYRYVGREPGLSVSFERIDNHWNKEKPAFKELVFRLAREEVDPARTHPVRRGPHRRPASRAAEGRAQARHEDLLVVVPGRLDDRVPRRPVLHAQRPGVQAGGGLDQEAGAAGAQHGHQPQGAAQDGVRRQGPPHLCDGLVREVRRLQPGVEEPVRPDVRLQPDEGRRSS